MPQASFPVSRGNSKTCNNRLPSTDCPEHRHWKSHEHDVRHENQTRWFQKHNGNRAHWSVLTLLFFQVSSLTAVWKTTLRKERDDAAVAVVLWPRPHWGGRLLLSFNGKGPQLSWVELSCNCVVKKGPLEMSLGGVDLVALHYLRVPRCTEIVAFVPLPILT